MKNAEKLIKEVTKKIQNSEMRTVRMKGVSNLSRSDLEMSVVYAENFIRNNGQSFGNFMKPMGNIKELLDAYGVKAEENSFW